jgi:hypothetical protein
METDHGCRNDPGETRLRRPCLFQRGMPRRGRPVSAISGDAFASTGGDRGGEKTTRRSHPAARAGSVARRATARDRLPGAGACPFRRHRARPHALWGNPEAPRDPLAERGDRIARRAARNRAGCGTGPTSPGCLPWQPTEGGSGRRICTDRWTVPRCRIRRPPSKRHRLPSADSTPRLSAGNKFPP